jgi:phosphoenolpyruvate---glycerone phosphotransferase subunit DhaK
LTLFDPAAKDAAMKKLINHVDTVLHESLDGFAMAHGDIVTLGEQRQFIRRREPKTGKVALISGGGSGHEPLHAGFVGTGMLDAACPGQVFTSPTPDQMLAAAQAVETGAGVLFIVKNYSGDMMNFQMAAEMLDRDNATVIVNDDVAVENSTYTTGRRGVAGTLIVEKLVGAAAERGSGLAELKALGDAVNKATASMGVALSSCTVPAAGKPTFQIGHDEMEMGVGIHGEPGRRRVKLAAADEIAAELTGSVLKDLSLRPGQQAILLVNGFGGTPTLELYLMVHAAMKVLGAAGVNVVRHLTGSYVTSLEMAGCSISVTAVDAPLLALWDAPVHTAALRWGM